MTKHLDSKQLRQERINNMKKWTAADYQFYQSFFDEIYGEEESSTDEEEAYLEEAYQQFMEKLNALRDKMRNER